MEAASSSTAASTAKMREATAVARVVAAKVADRGEAGTRAEEGMAPGQADKAEDVAARAVVAMAAEMVEVATEGAHSEALAEGAVVTTEVATVAGSEEEVKVAPSAVAAEEVRVGG